MSWDNFQNKTCEYFPCHNIEPSEFNCFGCYCPLYPYMDCGGNYKLIGNIKDCSECLFPHKNPDKVLEILTQKMST